MRKKSLLFLADVIFVVHLILMLITLFGGFFWSFWKWYLALLVVTFVLDRILGYCILSKWEFVLRKKVDPKVNYNYSYSSYYVNKFVGKRISDDFVEKAGLFFLPAMIIIIVYFHIIVK